ncbi:MAG: cobaltochelatase subunit CobN, partial [Euryarchaeota archaeon]
VDAAVHNIVNVWGLLDCDDYYDWLGGINFYVYRLTGKRIDVYVQYAVNPSAARVRTLAEELAAEVRTKFLSESWMRAFLEHGDYGWARLAERMEYWTAWGVVAPQVARLYTVLYDQVAENLLRWIETHGPTTTFGGAAVQSILAWMVEAMRIGTWNPKPELATRVIEAYIRYTAKYGPATCHHTSTNPLTLPFAVRYLTLYAPERLRELQPLIQRALRWYARLDNRAIVRQIERLLTETTRARPTRTVHTRPGPTTHTAQAHAQATTTQAPTAPTTTTTTAPGNPATGRRSPTATTRPTTAPTAPTSHPAPSETSSPLSATARPGEGTPGAPTGHRRPPTTIGVTGATLTSVPRAIHAGATARAASSGKTTPRTAPATPPRESTSGTHGRTPARSSARPTTMTRSNPTSPVSPHRMIWIWLLGLLLTTLATTHYLLLRATRHRGPTF